jgi:DNA topoisomerase-2
MPRPKKQEQEHTISNTIEHFNIIDSSAEVDKKNYKKLSHIEHILVRPSTYIGSIEKTVEDMFIMDYSNTEEPMILKKSIEYIPGLYKIFDEILVNATDHDTRLTVKRNQGDTSIIPVSNIKVDIEKDTGRITVYNDGDGIHVVEIDEHSCYAPELIFGHLLTGTNYNDSEERIVGGQNGYGAKLANIFSKEFTIETVDKTRNLKYIQTFTNNMTVRTEPKITTYSSKPYTRISFIPDYKRFGLDGLTSDIISLLEKRVYDTAAWTNKTISVFLNNTRLECKTFEKYIDLYIGPKSEHPRVHLELGDRWEVIATYNSSSNFEQVSFVNGIHTSRGGKHLEYIVSQIRDGLVDYIKKKKKVIVKPATIRNELFIFLKSTITNPSFDSQTKETLTTPVSKFGSVATIDDKAIDKIAKIGIMERIMNAVDNKNNKDFQKTDGKKQNIIRGLPKLNDADMAGTKDSKKCILILTEGDSAKSSVLSGLGQEGRDYYGVFPLRGKLLNIKDTDQEKVINNAEIQAIKKILGLKAGVDYSIETPDELWELRYGKIMILCDSDVDGSHIKGLLMNLFHSYWPSLLQAGFVITMLTPIVKVFKGKVSQSFYNLGDYKTWKDNTQDHHLYEVKYYKGLGTSSAAEFKEYFKDMKVLNYEWTDDSNNAIDLAFNKKRADDRKKWLENYDIFNVLDYKKQQVPIEDFINKDLIHFSNYDNIRSIPNVCDGLKPSQRKILYSAFKRNLYKEIKVAQFAGYVSEHAAYHHGEVSLQGTITGMAQNFVGSNNIALFVPNGAFGTRLSLGKDAASARYIFTHLHPITSYIYRQEDLPIMSYLDDDGFSIEPTFYMPIIPMILINGATGIGTGYSSDVPSHNPQDIITQLLNLLDGKPMTGIKPWYCGFKGEILKLSADTQYVSKGKYTILDSNTIEITEIPIGVSTEKYKEFLEDNIIDKSNPNKKQFIKTYKESCVDNLISFNIKLDKAKMDELEGDPLELEKAFKLIDGSKTSYSNMHLYDSNIHIYKYAGPYDIIMEFYGLRLEYYEKRKVYQLGALKNELDLLKEKYRFISMIINNQIDVRGKTKISVESMLEDNAFLKLANTVGKETGFDYLVQMPIYAQTKEKLDELKEKLDKKQKEHDDLLGRDIKDIWRDELVELSIEVAKYYVDYEQMLSGEQVSIKKGKAKPKKNRFII